MGAPVELTSALTRLVSPGSRTGFALLDRQGLISYVSPGAMEPMGYPGDAAVGLSWKALLPETMAMEELGDAITQLGFGPPRPDGHLGEGVVRLRTKEGLARWLHLSMVDGRDDPQLNGMLILARGVTGQRLANEATMAVASVTLRDAVDKVAAVFAQVVSFDRLALSAIDGDAIQLLAVSGPPIAEGLIGAMRPVHEAATEPLLRAGWQVVSDSADPVNGDRRAVKVGVGSYLSVVIRLAGQSVGVLTLLSATKKRFHVVDGPMLAEAAAGPGVALLLLAQLETQRREASELLDRTAKLLAQATTDPLTGLINRNRLREILAKALREAAVPGARGGVGLLFCDLDRFKVVNDALGHHVGDTLLQQVATRLRRNAPHGSIVARLGGDEFVVLLPSGADNQLLIEAGVILQRAVAEPIEVDHHRLRVELSAGAVVASPGDTPDAVLQHADTAMYRAKAGGRQRVALWTEQVGAEALARFDLERELALALAWDTPADSRITVAYQPVVDLASGRMIGVEALARWRHPEFGDVSPTTFVSIAEEVGLSASLTAAVAAASFSEMRQWRKHPGPRAFGVGINISGRDLADPAVLHNLGEQLVVAQLGPGQLVIELTETAIAQASDEVLAELHRLRELGANLALDDFGTGFSSLVHLRELPVTSVKIDRSFVSGRGDGTDPDAGLADAPMVGAIVGLATSLNLMVVAEGIETSRQASEVMALSCRTGQGWLHGRPVSAAEITARIARDEKADAATS